MPQGADSRDDPQWKVFETRPETRQMGPLEAVYVPAPANKDRSIAAHSYQITERTKRGQFSAKVIRMIK
jgi:hypothetical protein